MMTNIYSSLDASGNNNRDRSKKTLEQLGILHCCCRILFFLNSLKMDIYSAYVLERKSHIKKIL